MRIAPSRKRSPWGRRARRCASSPSSTPQSAGSSSRPDQDAAMYRHDYILRLIQHLGAALVTLRDRILRRERDEIGVREEVGEIARQAGLDLEVARSLHPQQLLMWLAPVGEPDPAKLWLMAE